MVIFQGYRCSDDIGTLDLIVCVGRQPWARDKGVDGLLEPGKAFVDAFDLLLASSGFSTDLDSLSAYKPEA